MHTLSISAPDDRSIVMTRSFDAPRELVFDAHTKPELIKQWLGVGQGLEWEVCEVDLRVGGHYRYAWVRGDFRMAMGGVFLAVEIPTHLKNEEKFDDPWYEGQCIGIMDFVQVGKVTTLTMTLLYDTKEIRDKVLASPMDEGLKKGYDILENVLTEIQTHASA